MSKAYVSGFEDFGVSSVGYEDADFNFNGLAQPFADIDVDFDNQTGSDWYQLALSASLGGKIVHGVTTAPACETIAKTTFAFAANHMHGSIRFDDRVLTTESDDDLDDYDMLAYRNNDFKGVKSTADAFLAFDQGEWEPSTRTRAREAAILAAGIAAHTGEIDRACDTVSLIASDEVPKEAVHNALVPISHLTREVVHASKGVANVFSSGTIQRAITWEDSNISRGKLPLTAALDWGRLTAIARYIAEVNIRTDENFTSLAKTTTIPYAIVSGSWATVSASDYAIVIPTDIPKVDLAEFGVPTLAKAYADHEVDALRSAFVAKNEVAYNGAPVEKEVLIKIITGLKLRAKPRKHIISKGTDTLQELTSHSLSADTAAKAVEASATAFNAYKEAAISKILSEPKLERWAQEIVIGVKEQNVPDETVNQVTTAIMHQAVWEVAHDKLTLLLRNAQTATKRLGNLKRTYLAHSGDFHTTYVPTGRSLRLARPMTIHVCKEANFGVIPKFEPIAFKGALSGHSSVLDLQRFVSYARDHLDHYARAWATRYEGWAKAYANVKEKPPECIMYGTAAKAFRTVTLSGLLAPEAGYVDMSDPFKCYLWTAAANYCRKRHMKAPELLGKKFASARKMAKYLDREIKPVVLFTATESFASARLANLASDFILEEPNLEPPDPPPAEPITAISAPVKKLEPAPKPAAMSEEELEAELEALMSGIPRVALNEVTEENVLRSYPTPELANKYAIANGYVSFHSAYVALKAGARFDEETEYCQRAYSVTASHEASRAGDAILS